MTRLEAIELHQKLLELHRTIRGNSILDIIVRYEDSIIKMLEDEIEHLSNMSDENWNNKVNEEN